MKTADLTIPEIAIIGATRGALGAGIALLLSDSIERDRKRSIGWTLTLIGAVSTIPILMNVLGRAKAANGRCAESE